MSLSPLSTGAGSGAPGSGLGRNFFWMTWSGLVSIANSVLIWVFMARMRHVHDVAEFTIVMGLYALFFSIVSLGLMPYVVNEVSRRLGLPDPDQSVSEFVSSASTFLLISGFVMASVMTASGALVSGSWMIRISTLALSLGLIPTGLIMVAEASAIAHGRVRLVAVVTTLENLLRTILPLALIWANHDIFVICLSFAAVRFVTLLTYVITARVRLSEFSFTTAQFRKIASICPTFAGTIVFASINWQAALILLGYLSTDVESAKFGVASRFLIPVTIILASYANVIQPALAGYVQRSPEHFAAYLSKVTRLPLIAAGSIAIISPLFAVPVLTILFGESYATAAPTLNLLALSAVPFCLVMVVARGLVAVDAQRIDLLANILGVGICIIAALLLIPRYGAAGAACAQLLSFLSMAVVEMAYLSRRLGGFALWRPISIS